MSNSTTTQQSAPAATPAAGQRAGLWAGSAPAPKAKGLVLGALATVVSLVILVALGKASHQVLMIAPLAATAMIICASPGLPPAQPRGVLLGQLGSAVLGFVAAGLFGHSLWVAAVAAGVSVGVMGLLRAVHAPAAATAALVVVQHPAEGKFLVLLAIGSVLLIVIGIIASRINVIGKYPTYWW
ncbi:HPP family protein [Kitasatospora sp. MMS16-BH015]|uniref:HPP family protein n=1 Tax=Kitasatospora sp. MMS16-BH015 TaxID=2018025 RepID=UPI000CA3B76B|nr:HPP family protein [Kitasatospora sp. MMS16-BH015]AUG78977.1 HPP family protein [Kitasatospora sp. MMS16-BH015]